MISPINPSRLCVPATNPVRSRPGFTLVELMISIGLSLFLVVGINAIFRTTAATVSTGQALLSDTRELRNAFDAFDADFSGFLDGTSQPLLLISNQNLPGFSNSTEEKSDADWVAGNSYENALHFNPGKGPLRVNGSTTSGPPVTADSRNRRLDVLSFFSTGKFRRQTAVQNDATATYQSLFNSHAAYITYRHARLPNATQANWSDPSFYVAPGMTQVGAAVQTAANNPNGFYTNQWVLARTAILLAQPDNTKQVFGVSAVANGAQIPQAYLNPTQANATSLEPFAYGTKATYNGAGTVNNPNSGKPIVIQDSLCDVAGITASNFFIRTRDAAVVNGARATNPNWFRSLLCDPTGSTDKAFRFACKPWLTRAAMSGSADAQRTDMGLTTPAFIHGCGQFIVEFAGDYYEQNTTTGAITNQRADGVLDFDAITLPGVNPKVIQKRIRWYGMPRRYPDTDPAINATGYDVAPVYAYGVPLPFEKATPFTPLPNDVNSYVCAWSPHDFQWPNGTAVTSPPGTNISSSMTAADDAVNIKINGVSLPTLYPKGFMPWMIRLTIRVDDANGRLPDGQTIQYVFNLPHP